jgi:hypothetical protein
VSEATDVAIAEESILKQLKASAWYADSALTKPLAAPIADAFREALESTD